MYLFESIKRRNSLYVKLILLTSLGVFVLVFLLTVLLDAVFSHSATEMIETSNAGMLSQISYSATYMDDQARRICQSAFLDNSVVAYMNSNEADSLSVTRALNAVDSLTLTDSSVQSIYLYSSKQDTFLSTETGIRYTSSEFYDKGIAQLFAAGTPEVIPLLQPIPRKKPPVPWGGQSQDSNVYTYIIYDKTGLSGALILNIRASILGNTINALNVGQQKPGGRILVVDNRHRIVSENANADFLSSTENETFMQAITKSASASGTYTATVDGRRSFVSYVSSKTPDWVFIRILPYDSLFAEVYRVQDIAIGLGILTLLLGLVYSVIVSGRIYSPIRQLVQMIHKNSSEDYVPNISEVGIITAAYKKVVDKISSIEQNRQEDQNRQALKRYVLGKNACIPAGARAVFQVEAAANNESIIYRLILLRINRYTEFLRELSEQEQTNIRKLIQFSITEILNPVCTNLLIDLENDCFAAVVCCESQVSLEISQSQLKTAISDINEAVRLQFRMTLSASLSEPFHSLEALPNAYNETMAVAMYRLVLGYDVLLTVDAVKNSKKEAYKVPAHRLKTILDALKLGKLEQAKSEYDQIATELADYSYNSILISIISLAYSIYNSISPTSEFASSKLSVMLNEFFANINTIETMDEINNFFEKLFFDIIQLNESTKGRRTDMLIAGIEKHIIDNYQSPAICLNSVADELNMSPLYIGRVFKDAIGMSVSEYIMDIRMKNVGTLLQQTNLPMEAILQQCGLEKTTYFYTAFKKFYGMTPKEYRIKLGKSFF